MLCAVTLVVGLMGQGRACEEPAGETRVVHLGFGELAIGLPKSWHIDEGTVVIEIVTYSVVRADGSAALTITMSASPNSGDLGTSALRRRHISKYCRTLREDVGSSLARARKRAQIVAASL
jgi:hypothetical protein